MSNSKSPKPLTEVTARLRGKLDAMESAQQPSPAGDAAVIDACGADVLSACDAVRDAATHGPVDPKVSEAFQAAVRELLRAARAATSSARESAVLRMRDQIARVLAGTRK